MVLSHDRFGFMGQAKWRATMLHGGILVALVAVLTAPRSVVALMAALLAHPMPTMTTLDRAGARGTGRPGRPT